MQRKKITKRDFEKVGVRQVQGGTCYPLFPRYPVSLYHPFIPLFYTFIYKGGTVGTGGTYLDFKGKFRCPRQVQVGERL
jgi:hypothetical protein